jgi:hypothetical protein
LELNCIWTFFRIICCWLLFQLFIKQSSLLFLLVMSYLWLTNCILFHSFDELPDAIYSSRGIHTFLDSGSDFEIRCQDIIVTAAHSGSRKLRGKSNWQLSRFT